MPGDTRNILRQYNDLRREISDVREDIERIEDDIERLIREGTVKDHVRGGLGGIEGFHIEGFPIRAYAKRRRALENKRNYLREKESDLIALSEEIERFIDLIPDSRDRLVFKKYYLKDKTQQEIAREMYIDRSLVSKVIAKYV